MGLGVNTEKQIGMCRGSSWMMGRKNKAEHISEGEELKNCEIFIGVSK